VDRLLHISKAAEILGVVQATLRKWDESGAFKSIKTEGGHRRYRLSDVNAFMGHKEEPVQQEIKPVCIYARVSSHEQKQKGDLDRQSQRLSEHCAKNKYKVEYIIKDVGSGLSDARAGLNKLFGLVLERKISKAVIEHKDRLTRFQFNVLFRFFVSYGVSIECVEHLSSDDENELANDIMMLMAVFSGKLYGKRSAKRRQEKKELARAMKKNA